MLGPKTFVFRECATKGCGPNYCCCEFVPKNSNNDIQGNKRNEKLPSINIINQLSTNNKMIDYISWISWEITLSQIKSNSVIPSQTMIFINNKDLMKRDISVCT